MSTKRTIINADEELVIKGKLTIEGNVTQIETTQEVTNLQGNVFTINSDGSNTSAVLALNSNGTVASFTFNDANGSIVVNKPLNFGSQNISTAGNISGANIIGTYLRGDGSNITGLTTSIVTEGSRLYFTDARANTAIQNYISVSDAGGDGSLSLTSNSTNFAITYTGPSATEVRAHFSATNGIEYSNTTGVINLASSTAGNGLTYTTGVLAIGAGDGITVNADNVAVNNTVIRTTGDQTITGNTIFVGTTSINGNIVPTTANTGFIGTPAVHIGEIWANLVHAERLDLGDANIADIHSRFVAGNVTAPYLTTNTAGGLVYTHNATSAGYQINPGDGLQLVSNAIAVDSTVVRTTSDQTITGNTSFVGNVSITGNLDVTANINSLTVVDLLVQDANIVLRSNSVSDGNAQIFVERGNVADTYIKWDAQSDAWKFTNNGTTEFLIPTSTTDLNEGNNLYFTTGRVNTAIDAYIIGGNGLTYTTGNVNIGQGDGITVNADNVSVDSSVVRTTSNQSIAGVKTFTGELVVPSITSATVNNSIFVNPSSNSCFIVINGNPVQLTADSDVGQVETANTGVGPTGITVYAGFRQEPVDNVNIVYHGIRSIDGGTYTTASVASNVITIDGNITAIRGSLSTANVAGYGNLSYNSSNGLFSYSGVTDSQIRTLFSGSGLITYNSANGSITTSADNYGSWTVQTDSGVGAVKTISSSEKLTIQSGTGITVTNTGNVITITNDSVADIESVSAGDGLTGGGNSGNVTLNIGAGAGITVNADNVAVDSSVVRTTSNQSIAGIKTFTNDVVFTGGSVGTSGGSTNLDFSGANKLVLPRAVGSSAESDGCIYNFTGTQQVFVTYGGVGIELLKEDSNGNAHIRSLFSASGDISYNASTGAFSFTNDVGDIESVSAGDGLTGGGISGAVTLNIGAGAGITVNADNVALTSGVITAGTYGTANAVPAITVDTYGRVTSVSNTSISITASQVSNFTSAANTAIDNRIVAGSGLTYSSGTLAVGAGSYINVGADDISVNASTTATASTIAARDASGNITANVFVGVSTSARYADLAENYLADGDYLSGTVLVFGGDAEVTASMSPSSTRIAGVVTTQPAHVMNSHLVGPHVACIALRGRVPVKVMGVVRKGDVLVSAGEGYVGYATAALYPRDVPAAAMVGKAIGDKLDAGPGVVEALI
jgi:hypothetical protein